MTKSPRLIKQSLFLIAILLLAIPPVASTRPSPDRATTQQLEVIRTYIKQSWHTLTRSNAQLASAAVDPKFHPQGEHRWPVYIPRTENLKRIEETLRAQMSPENYARIVLRPLPDDTREIREPGLVYLPNPYVVPGGRFNEMGQLFHPGRVGT
jgi:alpha,alpha-trehalase